MELNWPFENESTSLKVSLTHESVSSLITLQLSRVPLRVRVISYVVTDF